MTLKGRLRKLEGLAAAAGAGRPDDPAAARELDAHCKLCGQAVVARHEGRPEPPGVTAEMRGQIDYYWGAITQLIQAHDEMEARAAEARAAGEDVDTCWPASTGPA